MLQNRRSGRYQPLDQLKQSRQPVTDEQVSYITGVCLPVDGGLTMRSA
jgi:hypothetical protein